MKSERALLVEDDASWKDLLQELLDDAGLTVDHAGTLEEAEELVRHFCHRLAVVDLSLGGHDHRNRDGLAVLEAIKKSDPSCQSILLSGYATVEIAVEVLTQNLAINCLRKESFSRAKFQEMLDLSKKAAPGSSSGERAVSVKTRGSALLVEDDAGWRELLQELLEEKGLEVVACASFAEGLGHLQRKSFQMAVIDLALASSVEERNQDGLLLVDEARALSIPTVVVSGTSSPETVSRAFREAGVFGFFEKQAFERQAFLELVERELTPSELDSLTEREREVLDLLAEGLTNNQIAERLFISTNTVKRHLKTVFDKLGVNNRAAAAALVTREGG